MALPTGVTTCVVTAGAPLDFAGQGGTITLTVTPILGGNATNIVWQATGQPLVNFPMTATADATEQAQVVIPHSDQAGFVNGAGDAFSGWSYKAQIVFKGANRQQVAWTKVFQIPSGQTSIDLDLVPDGSITSPTTAPIEPVTSVNGQTGAVTVEGATDASVSQIVTQPLTQAALAAQVGDAGTQVGAALAGAYAATKITGSAGSKSIAVSPSTQVGPNADAYTVFGGTTSNPNTIGDTALANVSGYDNHIWDQSIANVSHGHHGVTGGSDGHATLVGGSYGLCLAGYGMVGGTQNSVFDTFGTAFGGRNNIAGAVGVTTLAAQAKSGDTTITVASASGMVAGQWVWIDYGANVDRARIASIAGTTVSLDTFQSVSTTDIHGNSTGTALAVTHPSGTIVAFGATGSRTDATVGGGLNNRALGVGSTVAGGQNNTASGDYSIAAGSGNTASARSAVALGDGNTASAFASFAQGNGSLAANQGQRAFAAGVFAVNGDAQASDMVSRTTTTDAATKSVAFIPQPNSAVVYRATVIAHDATGAGDVSAKAWTVTGAFRRDGSTVVTQIGSPTVTVVANDANAAAWGVATLTGTGSFNLRITGEASKTIHWVARWELTEVI